MFQTKSGLEHWLGKRGYLPVLAGKEVKLVEIVWEQSCRKGNKLLNFLNCLTQNKRTNRNEQGSIGI